MNIFTSFLRHYECQRMLLFFPKAIGKAVSRMDLKKTAFPMIERTLITVKTYPTLSSKYTELVCTASVNESGNWPCIYPVRFRQLLDNKYAKYQWIEAKIEKSSTDGRPQSYRIVNPDKIALIDRQDLNLMRLS